MAQQFTKTPQIKTRTAVLVFIKASAAPIVMYVENPKAVYEEIQALVKAHSTVFFEKETVGPIKRVSFFISQIAALAIQEEQYA